MAQPTHAKHPSKRRRLDPPIAQPVRPTPEMSSSAALQRDMDSYSDDSADSTNHRMSDADSHEQHPLGRHRSNALAEKTLRSRASRQNKDRAVAWAKDQIGVTAQAGYPQLMSLTRANSHYQRMDTGWVLVQQTQAKPAVSSEQLKVLFLNLANQIRDGRAQKSDPSNGSYLSATQEVLQQVGSGHPSMQFDLPIIRNSADAHVLRTSFTIAAGKLELPPPEFSLSTIIPGLYAPHLKTYEPDTTQSSSSPYRMNQPMLYWNTFQPEEFQATPRRQFYDIKSPKDLREGRPGFIKDLVQEIHETVQLTTNEGPLPSNQFSAPYRFVASSKDIINRFSSSAAGSCTFSVVLQGRFKAYFPLNSDAAANAVIERNASDPNAQTWYPAPCATYDVEENMWICTGPGVPLAHLYQTDTLLAVVEFYTAATFPSSIQRIRETYLHPRHSSLVQAGCPREMVPPAQDITPVDFQRLAHILKMTKRYPDKFFTRTQLMSTSQQLHELLRTTRDLPTRPEISRVRLYGLSEEQPEKNGRRAETAFFTEAKLFVDWHTDYAQKQGQLCRTGVYSYFISNFKTTNPDPAKLTQVGNLLHTTMGILPS